MNLIKFTRNNELAVIPTRANPSDIGLDLVAIKKYKILAHGCILYDTGISASPPEGYHLEIMSRSSITKTGWMLGNGIGLIDPSYTGNLYIALVKVFPDAPELEPPFCVAQLVLRKSEYGEMEEVKKLDKTERGDGGFGSTGSRIS